MNKIVHLLNLDTVGGVEELFTHFLQYAKNAKVENHVLVTGSTIHPKFKEQISRFASSITYEKYFLGCKIPKTLRALKKRYILERPFSHVVLWNRFEKISTPAKVVYYEHGASWMLSQGVLTPPFFDTVNTIIANSQAAKSILRLKWHVKKPIAVVENPLRPDLRFVERARTLSHLPLVVGFIGRLIPLKGASLLIQALSHLVKSGHDVVVKIAGVGSEQEKLKALSLELGLEKRIAFEGTVIDVESFYDAIDLLVVPSIREPLGLVALEAASRGVPVIAAEVDGLPEAVAHEKTGFCISPTLPISEYPALGGSLEKLPDLVYDPRKNTIMQPQLIDPRKIAERITYFIHNPTRYSEMSNNAVAFAKSRLDFDSYVEKLLTFILSDDRSNN